MRLLVDECIDGAIVALLRADGHDVLYAREELRRMDDEQIADHAFADSRLILTEDKGFGELVVKSGTPTVGVILLRIDPRNRGQRWPRLKAVLDQYGPRLEGQYAVIDDTSVRIRALPALPPDNE